MAKYDIFISYSRTDSNIVDLVVNRLRQEGLNVWIDEDGIESGDLFKKVITNAIENSACMLFFSSFASNQSPWTVKEIGIANYEDVPIIPVLLDDAKYNLEIKFDLINRDFVNMKSSANYDKSIARILKSIKKLLADTDSNVHGTDKTKTPPDNIVSNTATLQSNNGSLLSDNLSKTATPAYTNYANGTTQTHKGNFFKRITMFYDKRYRVGCITVVSILFSILLILATYFACNPNILNDAVDVEEETADLNALYERACECYDSGDYQNAVRYFREAAEQGHPDAQYGLGECYFYGNGVEQNYLMAVEWYRKAAEQGQPDAQFSLGACYYSGKGEERNYFNAAEWFSKAAEQGQPDAQYGLGECYFYANGVELSFPMAVEWYRKAAEQGQPDAQFSLGFCYYNGIGIKEDHAEAKLWLELAAQQGNESAKAFLENISLKNS